MIPYVRDIFEGLYYLSKKNIVHRDIKLANIFLSKGKAKIADFGFAQRAKYFLILFLENNSMMEKLEHRYVCHHKDFWKISTVVKQMFGLLVSYCISFHMVDCLYNIVQLKKCSDKAFKFN